MSFDTGGVGPASLNILGGGHVNAGSVTIGNAAVGGEGVVSVEGAGSSLTIGTVYFGNDTNGKLLVASGGRVNADAIFADGSNADNYVEVIGRNSLVQTATLVVNSEIPNSNTLTILEGGSLSVGSGGLTLDDSKMTIDGMSHIKASCINVDGSTIDVIAGPSAPGSVTISAPINLGTGMLINIPDEFITEGGAKLTLAGAITGQPGAILQLAGDVTLTNGANTYDGTQIDGRLEIAATGAAGLGPMEFLGRTELQIDKGVNFANVIADFGACDRIDLRGFAFKSGVSGQFASGVLTLNNGATTTSLSFAGSYSSANFVTSSDHHGGTMIAFHK